MVDPTRQYCTPIEEGRNNGFKCNFCGAEIKGGGITRMKYHLSGNDPRKNVKPCIDIPLQIRNEIREGIMSYLKNKEDKAKIDTTLKRELRLDFAGGGCEEDRTEVEREVARSAKRLRYCEAQRRFVKSGGVSVGGEMGDQGVRKYCTSIEGRTRSFRCNFCQFEMNGGGITRMKYHLSGNDPRKNVKGCTIAPPEVRDEMRRHVLEIRKKKEKKQFLDATIRTKMRHNLMQITHSNEKIEAESQDFEVLDVKSPPLPPERAPKGSRSFILKKLVENQSELQKILIDVNKRVAGVEKNQADLKKIQENIECESQDFKVQFVNSPTSPLPKRAPKKSQSLILKKLVENQSEIQKILIDMDKRLAELEKNHADSKKFQSSENSYSVRPERDNGGKRKEKLWNECSGFDCDDDSWEPKRHKPLNYGQTENVSSSGPEVRNVPEPILVETSESLDKRFEEHTACAFCHSLETSPETGSMLHYSNEQSVSGQEAKRSNVIHVHRLCINWSSPQVSSVNGKARNLEAEVARCSKLECSSCGVNGASLGCYVKSCLESYHVPCALRISKCRWDYENSLMLCSSHSLVRFPNENFTPENVSNKLVVPSIGSSRISDMMALPDKERKLFLCGSDLSIKEKFLLVKFGKMGGFSVSKFWNPNVTHVIAATDKTGACARTLKVLMAILNGIWILNVDWIKACIEAKSYVDEEPFEIGLDNYGSCDGPKNGRLRALNNGPKLFGGLSFYFVGDFPPYCRNNLEDLIVAGGGALIKTREELSGQSSDIAAAGQNPTLIIYNVDPPEECEVGEKASIVRKRVSEAEDVAMQNRSRVIGHTWLLESIGGYQLEPFSRCDEKGQLLS